MTQHSLTRLSLLVAGLCWICAIGFSCAQEFHHIGTYQLFSQTKITISSSLEIPVVPINFQVHCDGVQVKVAISGQPETETTYQIYRSDGLARQRPDGTAIEVVPGIQAICQSGGVLRHLRLSKDLLTMTTFPDAVDQTLVIYAKSTPSQTTP